MWEHLPIKSDYAKSACVTFSRTLDKIVLRIGNLMLVSYPIVCFHGGAGGHWYGFLHWSTVVFRFMFPGRPTLTGEWVLSSHRSSCNQALTRCTLIQLHTLLLKATGSHFILMLMYVCVCVCVCVHYIPEQTSALGRATRWNGIINTFTFEKCLDKLSPKTATLDLAEFSQQGTLTVWYPLDVFETLFPFHGPVTSWLYVYDIITVCG